MGIVEMFFLMFMQVHNVVIEDVYQVNVIRWECDSFALRELAVREALNGERSWSSCYQDEIRSQIPFSAFENVVKRSNSASLLK